MKNNIILKILMVPLMSLAASFLLSNLNAQVTIGSRRAPVSGAILDLKEEGETVKGIGLPCVKLRHLTIPQGQTSLSSTIVGA